MSEQRQIRRSNEKLKNKQSEIIAEKKAASGKTDHFGCYGDGHFCQFAGCFGADPCGC